MSRLVCVVVGLAGTAPSASAEPEPEPEPQRYAHRSTAVVLNVLGGNGPYGMFGIELEQSFARWFAVGAGVGYAMESAQLGSMAKLRAPVGPSAFGVAVGVSRGDYREETTGFFSGRVTRRAWPSVLSIKYEGYFEYRTGTRTVLRGSLGKGAPLRSSDCEGCADPASDPPGRAYVALGFGTYF